MNPIYQNDFDKGEPGIRVFTSENIRFFPHIHAQIEIFYVLDGEVDVMVDGHTKRLAKNNFSKNKCENIICAFSGDDNSGYSYVIYSEKVNLSNMVKDINAALSGRGGGKKPMIQGNLKAKKETITEYFSPAYYLNI